MNSGEIISNAKQQLAFFKQSLDDILDHPRDTQLKKKSLASILVFGRSVTFVLQNLRSTEGPKFDNWYLPKQEEMKTDPLLVLFKNARNELEKQGKLHTRSTMYINHFNTDMLKDGWKERPVGTTGFFIGDRNGGSGWEVKNADGTTEKKYVDYGFLYDIAFNVTLSTSPIHHKGKLIIDRSVEYYCILYYRYLEEMIKEAVYVFMR